MMDEEDKKEDEEQQGMMAKAMHYWRIISHSFRHVIQSLLSYLALITMIVALTLLSSPHFQPGIYDAGED